MCIINHAWHHHVFTVLAFEVLFVGIIRIKREEPISLEIKGIDKQAYIIPRQWVVKHLRNKLVCLLAAPAIYLVNALLCICFYSLASCLVVFLQHFLIVRIEAQFLTAGIQIESIRKVDFYVFVHTGQISHQAGHQVVQGLRILSVIPQRFNNGVACYTLGTQSHHSQSVIYT